MAGKAKKYSIHVTMTTSTGGEPDQVIDLTEYSDDVAVHVTKSFAIAGGIMGGLQSVAAGADQKRDR